MSISTSKLGSNSHAFTDDSLIIAINVDPMGSIYGSFLTGIKLQLSISLHTIDSTIAKGYLVPLCSLLTNNIPSILPETRSESSAILDEMFDTHEKPHVSDMVRQAVANTNAIALFGKEQGISIPSTPNL